MNEHEELQASRQLWDSAAATFDNEPDHGLRDPLIRAAWREFLVQWLPPSPKRILDIGCGTGSLSLLLAELGHEVGGIDLSPAMIAQAEAKARSEGYNIAFQVMDAAHPHFPSHHFDLILCRHLLWTLPEPAKVLERWVTLLAPGGRLILVEGFWHTGAGLHSQAIVEALPASLTHVTVQNLSEETRLWGSPISDERYAVIADLGTLSYSVAGGD